ncbi:MAG: AraC family transcriptional regulator [Arachnia propionica]|uniref:helix-turn-helix transcriptional regulator n=1 Tax=Arachnia propionica TaxID=1750 RepID=UPI0027036654|nr:AraC family transcriptional regulator [Arachnia propionica]
MPSLTLTTPPVTISPRVHHDWHVLIWQVAGSSSVQVASREVHLPAEHGCWIPTGVWHSLTVGRDSVMLPISFSPTPTSNHLAAGTLHTVSQDLRVLLLAILQQQYSYASDVDLEGQAVAALLANSSAGVAPPWPQSPALLTIVSQLSTRPDDHRSAADLAASVHLSERTLQRRFLVETGLTLQQWRTRNRLVQALGMLRAGVLIDVTAHRVGYHDPSTFRRAFKAHFGVAPSRHAAITTPRIE